MEVFGARAGYSVLNGVFITIICLTGTLAWILGRADRCGHGDRAVDRHRHQRAGVSGDAAGHAPAVVVGLLPGIGAWPR
jgi:AGZA family xanthine/uracil permease-like MFS transporter